MPLTASSAPYDLRSCSTTIALTCRSVLGRPKTQLVDKWACLTCVWMYEGPDQLCERLAADVDEAFPELVVAHQDLVFGVALRVLRDASAAQDVAQDAFVRAYRALRRYPPERVREMRLRPWLARIALNAARNEVRARRADASHTANEALDDAADRLASPTDGPLRLVERSDE